jgi:hypothetical protein
VKRLRLTRHPAGRAALGLAVGFGGALALIVAVEHLDGPQSEPERLGSLDFEAFCRRESDNMTALLVAQDADGWQCAGLTAGVWGNDPVDVADVCRWQYGEDARALLVDANDVDGWTCVRD